MWTRTHCGSFLLPGPPQNWVSSRLMTRRGTWWTTTDGPVAVPAGAAQK